MPFTQSERDDNESRQYPGRQRSLGADNMRDLAYLKLLSREYPNIRAAASDIINLQAICGLPKGTEYFFSDLHGEHEAFIYLLRSSSGIIREKIRETFGHIISEEDEVRLANRLSDFELRRTGGNTYTADTLRLLKEEYPEVEFFFIAGADSIMDIEKWYHPEYVLPAVTFLAAAREHEEADRSLDEQISYLNQKYQAHILRLHCREMDVASAEIRAAFRAGHAAVFCIW